MPLGRIVIIPFLHGKLTVDGQLVEPDIDSILGKWLERHPEHREKKFHVIRPLSYSVGEIETQLVRVTAEFSPDLEDYDPTEDADLYEEFLAEKGDSPPRLFRKIWVEQCEAAEGIEADYGTEKALGYLIGEKLLNFLGVAETKPEWQAEVPLFIAKIKEMFETWQIAEFLETPRRLGTLGHIADDEGHKLFRSQVEESDNIREDARNLMLFEQAWELLLGDQTNGSSLRCSPPDGSQILAAGSHETSRGARSSHLPDRRIGPVGRKGT